MSAIPLQIPEWATPFTEPAFIKCAYGGRSSTKSQTFMRLILVEMMKGRSVGCFREIQKSIKDSIKKSIDKLIDKLGWRPYFRSTDTEIRCTSSGAVMIFAGLKHNVDSVKGMDWLDIAFCEEAENISSDSWQTLIPTFRDGDSEIWVAFNPKHETSATYRMLVTNPPPDYMPEYKRGKVRYSLIKKVNYPDNPWFEGTTSYAQMVNMRNTDYEMYLHIWMGEPLRDSAMAIIKPMWIEAALNAHLHPKFGHLFAANGNRFAGFDPADEGEDFNARVYRDNQTVYQVDEWKDRDAGAAGERVYIEAMNDGIAKVAYDNIGVGAAVKTKFRDIEEDLIRSGRHEELISFSEFTASDAPHDAECEYMPGRTNGDHFLNAKAQGWWMLRDRFQNTYRLIVEGKEDVDTNNLISIDCGALDARLIDKMKGELSAPMLEYSNGRIRVEPKDKLKKRGIPSPNIADAFVMAFAPLFDSGFDWDAWG